MFSCTTDVETLDVTEGGGKTILKATSESVTRTTMGDNHSVVWSEGDQINIYGFLAGSTSFDAADTFDLISGAGTTEGQFEGVLYPDEYKTYIGVYPTEIIDGFMSTDGVEIILNPGVTFDELNFIDKANPMVAVSSDLGTMTFKNLCGILEVKITGTGTINSLKISVGKGEYIAGLFWLDPNTCTLTPHFDGSIFHNAGVNYSSVHATLAEPITLSSTPRSVYAILPPGTYHDLSVQTIDDTGTLTNRTATKEITINRSQITTVTEFTHTTQTIPYASLEYSTDLSDFYVSFLNIQTNSLCNGLYYRDMTRSDYDSLIASGKTDKDIVLGGQFADIKDISSNNLRIYVYSNPNVEYVVLCAAVDENGEIQQEVSKCTFTVPDVPYTDDIQASVNEQNTVISENSISLAIGTNLERGKIMAQVVADSDIEFFDPRILEINTVLGTYYKGEIGEPIEFTGLIPSTAYTVYYTTTDAAIWISESINGEITTYTRYSNMATYKFTTAAHTPSAATVSLEPTDIKDLTATVTATLSEGSKKIKYSWNYANSEYPINADYVAAYGVELTPEEGSNTIAINLNTKEETGYVVYAIAYDENDSYGVMSQTSFTTTALTPTQDPEYTKFLGTYTMTYSLSGTDWSGSTPHTVTISQDVEGRSFLITGLLKEEMATQYMVPNTIRATFSNGKLMIPCTSLQSSVLGDVLIRLLSSDVAYIFYYEAASLETEYNDGVLTPKYTNPSDGILFDGIYFDTVYGPIDYYANIVLTKTSDVAGTSSAR